MSVTKEYREFFLRNVKLPNGAKKDQETNYILEYNVVDTLGKVKKVFNRFLKNNYPSEGVWTKLFESLPFKLNTEDKATTTTQGLAQVALTSDIATGNNVRNGFQNVVIPSQLKATNDIVANIVNARSIYFAPNTVLLSEPIDNGYVIGDIIIINEEESQIPVTTTFINGTPWLSPIGQKGEIYRVAADDAYEPQLRTVRDHYKQASNNNLDLSASPKLQGYNEGDIVEKTQSVILGWDGNLIPQLSDGTGIYGDVFYVASDTFQLINRKPYLKLYESNSPSYTSPTVVTYTVPQNIICAKGDEIVIRGYMFADQGRGNTLQNKYAEVVVRLEQVSNPSIYEEFKMYWNAYGTYYGQFECILSKNDSFMICSFDGSASIKPSTLIRNNAVYPYITTQNLASGFDWSAATGVPAKMFIKIGEADVLISLITNCSNVSDIIAELNAQFAVATDINSNPFDLTDYLEAIIDPTDGDKIRIQSKYVGVGFTLAWNYASFIGNAVYDLIGSALDQMVYNNTSDYINDFKTLKTSSLDVTDEIEISITSNEVPIYKTSIELKRYNVLGANPIITP